MSAEAPGTPFDLPEYQLAAADEAEALQTEAELRASDAGDANQTSDNYVVTARFALVMTAQGNNRSPS